MNLKSLFIKLILVIYCLGLSPSMVFAVSQAIEPFDYNTIKTPELEFAFKKVFRENKPDTIELLSAGFSGSKLYKISFNNKLYVLRMQKGSLPQNACEIKNMIMASKIGIAPKIYYTEAKAGIIIMNYVEPYLLTEKDKEDPQLIIKLASVLRTLHKNSDFSNIKQSTIVDVLNHIKKEKTIECNTSALVRQAEKALFDLQKILMKNRVKASTHNDLNPNNILYDGKRFWLIDWEYASYSDPYFDLATAANFNIFDKDLEALFLKSYFNRSPTPVELGHYAVMKQVSFAYSGILLAHLACKLGAKPLSQAQTESIVLSDVYTEMKTGKIDPSNPEHIQIYAAVLLNEALHNIQSNEFKNSLQDWENGL